MSDPCSVDPIWHISELLNALDLRLTTMIDAADAKSILRDEALVLRIESVEKAISIAREAMTQRLEGMNEIRASMADQASTFATREALAAISDKVEDLRVMSGVTSGWKSGNEGLVRVAIQGIMLVLAAVMGVVISHFVLR